MKSYLFLDAANPDEYALASPGFRGITLYTDLCEKTREDALELMFQHASERGANAVVAMRYDANEIMQGVTEVLAYGTAVQVERSS